MGVLCWFRKAFRYIQDRCIEDRISPNEWILLVTVRWVRRILDATEITNAGTRGAQGVNQPVGGTFVKRYLNHFRCKC
jgi:hypothetical protein